MLRVNMSLLPNRCPMDRKTLLKEMRDCVGTQNPVVFFDKMVDVFTLLFDRIDGLETDLKEARMNTALAIQWEPKVAQAMLADQINILRKDKDTYFDEITKLKQAFVEDKVTQNYSTFCAFWQETLGFHPFLNYE
jgi:hypothetical protein